ncbi:hypothetical protein [Streptomyces sp. NPDC059209]|uniref:hypothetical protein n=1 Tax=Streptomyces sp. NPDC059209 TaxID=3346769 RepID=UPI0036B148E7
MPAREPTAPDTAEWAPGFHGVSSTSTTTILRILRHLAKNTVRPRTTAVTRLMDYIPTAVTVGYLREPDMDLPLPLPGPDFARRVKELIAAAANRPDVSDTLPAAPHPATGTSTRSPTTADDATNGAGHHPARPHGAAAPGDVSV